jgi:hypothetical protein
MRYTQIGVRPREAISMPTTDFRPFRAGFGILHANRPSFQINAASMILLSV